MRRKKVTGKEATFLLVGMLVLSACTSTRPGAPGLPGAGPPSAGTPGNTAEATAGDGNAGEANPGGALTDEERGRALDGKLEESLRDFDRLLMREQEALAETRVTSESGTGGGGAGAGSAVSAGAGGEAGGRQGETGASGDGAGEATGDSPSAPVTGPQGGEHDGRVPSDVGDGSGDDIVARQLREAAMSQDDPELREKLWQMYRDYKNGQRRKDDGR